jgi:hypothetical protein
MVFFSLIGLPREISEIGSRIRIPGNYVQPEYPELENWQISANSCHSVTVFTGSATANMA